MSISSNREVSYPNKEMRRGMLILVCCLIAFANIGSAFKSNSVSKRCISTFRKASTSTTAAQNPFEQMMQSFQGMMTPKPKAIKVAKVVVDLTQYDDEINEAKLLLVNAAKTKKEDGDKVVDALLSLEQLMRKKNKLDEGEYPGQSRNSRVTPFRSPVL